MRYEATTSISASPSTVWSILTDVGRYPDWDSGVTEASGTVEIDADLTIVNEVAPGRRFRLRVTELVPGERMVWCGGLPLGLFTGIRTFRVEPGDARTRFVVSERYSGPLLPLIRRTMPDLQPSFDRFARGLRAEAERSEGAAS